MDGSNGGGGGLNSFALVSYFSGPLADYLTRIRGDLVADCATKAHLTVLPPRPIRSTPELAARGLLHNLQDFGPVLVELAGIRMFRQSRVIYVSIEGGHAELERIHDALNTGDVAFREPFAYHPHITLAQDLAPEIIDQVFERACDHWNNWPHPRNFVVEKLTFVQNTFGNCWSDLEEFPLVSRVAS